MLKFKTSDQINLAYEDQGEGMPVLFIAGYGAAAASWFSQREVFLQKGYRVISLDRRSHGCSDNPPYGHRLSRHAKDVHELIEYLGLSRVLLIGQSMGASTIYAYMSLFGCAHLSGAVSIDQTPKMLNSDGWPYGMYGLNKETMAGYFDTPIKSPFAIEPEPAFMARLGEAIRDIPPFDLEKTKPLLLDHAFAGWLDVLPLASVPFLFLAGKQSPFWPCDHAKAAAELCPSGEYAVIESCGHAVNWEQPEKCNDILLAFAQKLKGNY